MYPEKMQKGLAISKGVWYNSFRCQKDSKNYAPVAQLDSATDSDSVGHWFESSRAYQSESPVFTGLYFFTFDQTKKEKL